jgi:hypothetical protein
VIEKSDIIARTTFHIAITFIVLCLLALPFSTMSSGSLVVLVYSLIINGGLVAFILVRGAIRRRIAMREE